MPLCFYELILIFFAYFLPVFIKKMYICIVIAFAESPLGGKRARHIHKKGVTERFGFDVPESRKFKLLVKNKATGTPLGMFIYSPHWLLGANLGSADISGWCNNIQE